MGARGPEDACTEKRARRRCGIGGTIDFIQFLLRKVVSFGVHALACSEIPVYPLHSLKAGLRTPCPMLSATGTIYAEKSHMGMIRFYRETDHKAALHPQIVGAQVARRTPRRAAPEHHSPTNPSAVMRKLLYGPSVAGCLPIERRKRKSRGNSRIEWRLMLMVTPGSAMKFIFLLIRP